MLHDVRTLREQSGLSQSKFAEKYGVSARAVQAWEQGTRTPNPGLLQAMNDIHRLNNLQELSARRIILQELQARFGEDNIIQNYEALICPQGVDFYIIPSDIYIDVLTAWQHGHGWYDPNYINHQRKLEEWSQKAEYNKIYADACETWRIQDKARAEKAKTMKLNYVVFWDEDLTDFYQWLNYNCPGGHDYDGRKTWLENIQSPTQHNTQEKFKHITHAPDGFDFTENSKYAMTEKPDMLAKAIKSNAYYASSDEDSVYKKLTQIFGHEDVIQNHKNDAYPFLHIYIKSRDLHIEVHNSLSHGGHWYNENTDKHKLNLMPKHLWERDEDTMAGQWSTTDLIKRWYAGHNKLNYLVFWKPNLSDFYEWLDAGKPDAHDWLVEHSWKK